jgi:hypothetical protein
MLAAVGERGSSERVVVDKYARTARRRDRTGAPYAVKTS